MALSLNVDRVVRVTIDVAALAAQRRTFGIPLIIGNTSTSLIPNSERVRSYTTAASILNDGYLVTSPEYLAAQIVFAQTPMLAELMIGRWNTTASSANLTGGVLTPAEQTLATWQAITSGTITTLINGTTTPVTAINFSSASSLAGAAPSVLSLLDAAITNGTVTFSNGSFSITPTGAGGPANTIGYCTGTGITTGASADVSLRIKATQALALSMSQGAAIEAPVDAVTACANASGRWYSCLFASLTMPTDDQNVSQPLFPLIAGGVCNFVQSAVPERAYFITTPSAGCIDPVSTTDVMSRAKAFGYSKTIIQYSTTNPYSVASLAAKAGSVDYRKQNNIITNKFKQQPTIVSEGLTESQAQTLAFKRGNVFARYSGVDQSIVQEGVCSSELYIDELFLIAAYQNALQTSLWNLLYQNKRIPQTDNGQHLLVNTCASVSQEFVYNGAISPGVWNSAEEFGQLKMGDYLPNGFYIYTQPMALQAQSDREARIAPPIQIAAKLSGAVHSLDCAVTLNR
jgi:hypothetical protein